LANAQEPVDAVGWARRRIEQLERRIDELERELARARAEAKTFADDRDELRGQLEAASHNLNLLAEQSGGPKQGRAAQRLGSEEQALLYELRHGRRSS
jgi:septal ring factor EnvC (AmiA/AmiB activator)